MGSSTDGFFAGIDYGSKRAGTTVIAFRREGGIGLARSAAREDADRFIVEWCRQHRPARIFIDAPLSLPGVYRGLPGCEDYFYRRADRALSAMSPMFLGGLTARAMKLRATLEETGVLFQEVYPAALAGALGLGHHGYKKEKRKVAAVFDALASHLPVAPDPAGSATWHDVDALLAWYSGWRYRQQQHRRYGDPEEGCIVV